MFNTLCRWEEPEAPPCLSPTRPPGSPPRPALPKEQVGDDQRVVFEVKVILLIFSRLFPYYLLSSGHCWRGCATSLTLWLSRCSALFSILYVIWSGLWNCKVEPKTISWIVKVVTELLDMVETQLLEDKDKKLIMTMINIEHMRVNDFFFGIHCLLSLVRGFQLSSLKFSRRLWFCLWEYGESF